MEIVFCLTSVYLVYICSLNAKKINFQSLMRNTFSGFDLNMLIMFVLSHFSS